MPQPRLVLAGCTAALALALAPPLAAQGATPPPTCDAAEYRQFDFWLGNWNVTVNGRQAGTNRITREESGCLLVEHWTGARGGTGMSFNFFDRQDQRWHQLWVSSSGAVLRLAGTFANGQMRMTGETKDAQGATVAEKLTFSVNADGSVRQLWEQSKGGGAWNVVFDGLYTKQP